MGVGRRVSGMITNRLKYGVHSSPDTKVSDSAIGTQVDAYFLHGALDPGSTCSKTPVPSDK
jgi:hypothetical protein